MPNLIQSLLARLRGVGPLNRRRAPRYDARISFSISIFDEKADPEGTPPPPTLVGRTSNVSESGLALIVPSLHLGTGFLNDGNSTLRLVLNLPLKKMEQIEIRAVPVRSYDLGEKGHFIGAKITYMSDDARARFMGFLRSLRSPH